MLAPAGLAPGLWRRSIQGSLVASISRTWGPGMGFQRPRRRVRALDIADLRLDRRIAPHLFAHPLPGPRLFLDPPGRAAEGVLPPQRPELAPPPAPGFPGFDQRRAQALEPALPAGHDVVVGECGRRHEPGVRNKRPNDRHCLAKY